jgi:hypothetical protein
MTKKFQITEGGDLRRREKTIPSSLSMDTLLRRLYYAGIGEIRVSNKSEDGFHDLILANFGRSFGALTFITYTSSSSDYEEKVNICESRLKRYFKKVPDTLFVKFIKDEKESRVSTDKEL